MFHFRRVAVFLAAVFLNPVAHAGLYIEPFAGYAMGHLGQSGVPTIDIRAFTFGGRVGFRFENFTFGLDYTMGLGTGEQLGNQGDYRPTDIGAFVEYGLPFDLRAHGGVVILSKAKIHPDENSADFSGRSYRLGLAWSGLPVCTILVEALYRSYHQYGGADLSKPLSGLSTGVSIGLPLP